MNIQNGDSAIFYFKEISGIPRETAKEKQISDYLVEFAKKRNLEVRQDKLFNVVIKKKSNIKNFKGPAVILQGHMDMVYVKDADSRHVYENGLELIERDGCFYANKTSLGADNGIAVAYMLAILDTNEIKHPDLEMIFTVQEEAGMVGVQHFNTDDIKGKYFINFDTEEEGVLFTGCAGGVRNYLHLPAKREKIEAEKLLSVKISGLKSGHSGMEIHMGRGNGIKLMGRLLHHINNEDVHLCSISGIGKANVISNNCEALIAVSNNAKNNIINEIKESEKIFKKELQFTDNIQVDITEQDTMKNDVDALIEETKNKLIDLLMVVPCGVITRSHAIDNLVQTSMNVGSIEEKDNKISVLSFIRSSVESEKHYVSDIVRTIAAAYEAECIFFNDYPEWEYKAESKLRDMAVEAFEKINHRIPTITAVHAGLECGYFNKKLKDVDMISFGPDQYDVHTTNEHINIESIRSVWRLTVRLLEKLAYM